MLSPSITETVKTNWKYWSLLIVDETEEENVFYLNKLFKFELNLTVDDMNNNASISVMQNFTKYPTIQYGTANYWSGSLSALCGFISCDDVNYIQTPSMINELKSLTSDTRRKFLKDMDGKNGFHQNILAEQIRSCFIKMNDKTQDKELIFQHLVQWIKTKTCSTYDSACEAVVSFFVQNCEVFYEIT